MTNTIPHISYSMNISNPKLNPQKPYRLPAGAIDAIQKTGDISGAKAVPAKMLLALLNGGLNGKEVNDKIFVGRSFNDWANMYNLGHDNAVLPVMYDGIKNSPNLNVPDEIIENFEEVTKSAKRYHGKQEFVLKKLTEATSKEGIDTVQMKGIGYSMNYPDPQKRFGGDIDVFNFKHGTDFSNPENNMTHQVDNILKKIGTDVDTNHSYKHSEARIHGVPIENHRNFLNIKDGPIAEKLNKYLFKNLNPQKQILPNGTKILVPSKEFNNVFISFHAMQHFVGGGINFHHLADWAVHVKKNGLHIPEEIKGSKFEEFMNAFTNLADKHLGTGVKAPENKQLEKAIFEKMLYPEKTGIMIDETTKNPAKIFLYKCKKFAATNARKNEFFGGNKSLSKAVMDSIIAHCKNPKTLINVFCKIK